MPLATATAPPASKCPNCRGRMELVTPRIGSPYHRCATCGFDDRPAVAAASTIGQQSPRPCKVDGCPGALDANSVCPCCTKRAAYEREHQVTRECRICGGTVAGNGRKFCEACQPVRARVYARTHKNNKVKGAARG